MVCSFIRNFAPQMCTLDTLQLNLKRLEEGTTHFQFDLNDDYFKAVDAPEVERGEVHVDLDVKRRGDLFELDFHCVGTVHVPCDLCLDDMEQPIDVKNHLVARLGTEEYSMDDELVTVDEADGMLDTSWVIYEFIALDIPIKHVHAPGECNPAMTKMLEELDASRNNGNEEDEPVDPRWEALKGLKMDK